LKKRNNIVIISITVIVFHQFTAISDTGKMYISEFLGLDCLCKNVGDCANCQREIFV